MTGNSVCQTEKVLQRKILQSFSELLWSNTFNSDNSFTDIPWIYTSDHSIFILHNFVSNLKQEKNTVYMLACLYTWYNTVFVYLFNL